jgi:hypothetical protein
MVYPCSSLVTLAMFALGGTAAFCASGITCVVAAVEAKVDVDPVICEGAAPKVLGTAPCCTSSFPYSSTKAAIYGVPPWLAVLGEGCCPPEWPGCGKGPVVPCLDLPAHLGGGDALPCCSGAGRDGLLPWGSVVARAS